MSQPPQFTPVNPYPQPGEVLDGKYRIERLLGEGGMGAVAKATHLLRRAPVALKFMSPAVLALQGAVERFVNEGVAASQIDSDHVVKVFDVGRMPTGAPYLVMEFLDGRDLGQLLARDGRPAVDRTRAVHFALQILRALQTAHAVGDHPPRHEAVELLRHRQGRRARLREARRLRHQQGAQRRRRGQARANLTRTNSALGTPLYMSPEQARSPRDVDTRTDLYSVGAILYELLTGRTPYTAESGEYTEILFKIFTTDPEPLRTLRPDVPEGLAAVDRTGRSSRDLEHALRLGVGDGRGARAVRGRAQRADHRAAARRSRAQPRASGARAARADAPGAPVVPAPAACARTRSRQRPTRCGRRACRPTWASPRDAAGADGDAGQGEASRAALIAVARRGAGPVRGAPAWWSSKRSAGGPRDAGRTRDTADAGEDRGAAADDGAAAPPHRRPPPSLEPLPSGRPSAPPATASPSRHRRPRPPRPVPGSAEAASRRTT